MIRIPRNGTAASFLFVALAGIASTYAGPQVTLVRPYNFAISPPLSSLPIVTQGAPSGPTNAFLPVAHNFVNVLNFNGVGNGSYAYPDSNGAAGATQYMQWTNTRYAVYLKSTGKLVAGPVQAKTLWASLGGQCATTTAGDGIINYDKMAQRWVITHHTGAG